MRFTTRLRSWVVALIGAVVLIAAVGAIGIPAAARWAIETVGSRELGRALTVAQLRFNPFTLRVSARGLAMADADPAAAPFATIDAAAIDLSATSLFRLAPVIDGLRIDGLTIRVIRHGPQRFNFSDILDRLAARPRSADDSPARFSVSNIELANGTVTLDDRVLNARHALTGIALGVPFLSSLPTHAEIRVQPSFAARLNGTPIALTGETLPFQDTYETSIRLKLDGLALPEYLPFSPVRLNFEVPRGQLDTDLRIGFRAATAAGAGQPARAAELRVSGSAALRDFALLPAGSRTPIVAWQRLAVQVARFAPFDGVLAIDELALEGPQVEVARDADGAINWQRFAATAIGAGEGAARGGAAADRAAPPAATPSTAAPRSPLAVSLARLSLRDGRVRYVDEPLGRFEQVLSSITLDASGLSTAPAPSAAPAAPAAPATLSLAADIAPQGRLTAQGTLSLAPVATMLDVSLDTLALRAFARPLSRFIDGTLAGEADLRGRVEVALDGGEARVALNDIAVAARALRLRGPQDSGAEFDLARLALDGGAVDVQARTVSAKALSLDGARVQVTRGADGRIGWQQLARRDDDATRDVLDPHDARHTQRARDAQAPGAATMPWSVTLDALNVARSQLQFDDATVAPAARVQLTALNGSVRNLAADGSRRAEIALRSRVGTEGQLGVTGHARWDRLLTELRVDARALDLAPLRGYLARQLDAVLVSGELSSRAAITLMQPADGPLRVRYDGGARLTNLHLLDAVPGGGNDLLRWQSLGVDRMAVALGAGPPQVELGVVSLESFFARLILSEQGRLNLADLLRGPDDAAAAATTERAAAPAATVPAAPVPTAAPATDPAERPRIRVDRVQLDAGNINFTDNFIRPNYTANLTDLAGSVTTLDSAATAPATLTLAGRVNRDAPLSINGRLNPLAPTLFLDIEGVTKGVDLPQLTPYSAKYAGYPITKGKLSLDIRYRIADNKLEASNRLFLDQLTFGERVDSPTATRLPVLLAVALLKNSRGEIDLNLPISGSLSDPQFSIGGVIVQVIVNLLTKAITAPFSLLAAAFGAGEELAQADFAAGSAVLADDQLARLEKLAKALNDRPALRLDITGRADAALDAPGLRELQFESRLRTAKIKALVRGGGASVDPAQVTISAAERASLIDAAYADEPIADKPRVLGIARNLPTAEKEKLLRAHLARQPLDLRALASARATAVRDWLELTGKVSRERLFIVEPKISESVSAQAAGGPAGAAAGTSESTAPARGARTGVDFSLK